MKTDWLVFHTTGLAALDSVFCSGTRRQINIILYGVPRAADGAAVVDDVGLGFGLAVIPVREYCRPV